MTITIAILAVLLVITAVGALLLAAAWQAERRRAEESRRLLDERQALIQNVLDAVPLPVLVGDRRGARRWTNRSWQALGGLDRPGLRNLGPDAPGHARLFLARDGTDAANLHRAVVFAGSDGADRRGVAWDIPLSDPAGGAHGVVTTVLDLTAVEEEIARTKRLEAQLREVASAVPLVAFAVQCAADGSRRLVFVAGDTQALFGVDAAALVGLDGMLGDWPFGDRVHPEDVPSLRRVIDRHAAAGPRTLDFRSYGRDGLRWVHLLVAPRSLMPGETYWAGYFLDTTHLNVHNEVLKVARDAAERASKAKADFLATMSHEIRTPMHGVTGMLELLGHTRLDGEQRELLQAVEDSAAVLLKVLNDVLDFSRLEAGELKLDPQPFDPRALVDQVAGSMAAQAHGKGLKLRTAVDADVAGQLLGDNHRLSQVLLNLLGNAIKFTTHGSVSVRLRVDGDDGRTQRLRLSVADTGVGISPVAQARLFAPFVQASEQTARHYGGSGLGLAVCRRLMELMGGRIDLSSEPGAGTTVVAELQLPVSRREAVVPELAGRHAIVRLSDVTLAQSLSEQLTALGATLESIPPATTLRQGMSASLLFVEPGDLASERAVAARVIVVADEPAIAIGTDHRKDRPWLSADPLRTQSLLRACRQALEVPAAAPQAPPPGTDPSGVPGRPLLVVDDHPVSRALVRRQLARLGWECDVVGDGEAALRALALRDYAMLLTDCNMPVMDGYELTQRQRERETEPGRRRLPIVAMTAHAMEGEALRCREAGMDDVLCKPVTLGVLDAVLKRWLPATSSLADDPDGISPSDNALVAAMRTACEGDLAALQTAWLDRNADLAAQKLHRLTGAIQIFTTQSPAPEGRRMLDALQADPRAGTLATLDLPSYVALVRTWLNTLATRTDI